MPLTLLRDAPDMLTSWDVTSDSIALWLARRLNAERLVVVKACEVVRPYTLAELSESGLVDRRFAQWASDVAFPIEVVECDDLERVRDALLSGTLLAGLGAPSPGASSGSVRDKTTRARPRRKSIE
jgi:aspartokinase-like uncharacterized kinase